MKIFNKYLIGLVALFLAVGFTAVGAKKKKTRVATGFQGGTYYHVGNSLNALPGVKVTVLTTRGSVQNIQLVADRQAAIAMAQMDILINRALKNKTMKKNVKILLPIYEEEVHIVASRSILGLSDMKSKRINIGPSGSGIRGTAKIVLQELGFGKRDLSINKSKTLQALQKVTLKEIDGLFIVSGAPVEMLAQLPSAASKRIHMLSMDEGVYKRLQKRFPYERKVIKSGTYPWQDEDVNTVSVSSVLIGQAKLPGKLVKAIVKGAIDKKSTLESKHSKWGELNVAKLKNYLKKYRKFFHPASIEVIESL